jgi:hypothetical protein
MKSILNNVWQNAWSSPLGSSESSNWTQQSWYGYELDEANSSPDVTRIAGTGKLGYHATLPVQSLIRGCLLSDSGIVNYYLDPDDWSKKADGSASNLDGTDGQVMVEIPKFYHKIDNPSSGVYQHKISRYPISGFAEIPKFYVSSDKAQIQRSTLKLASVRSLSTDYRGGDNNAAWDVLDKTLLGKPASVISLINFRTYARNRGSKWNVLPYRQLMLLYDLFTIEYATRNSQKAVNANLTAEGYKQGGMGVGVNEFWDWGTYNDYYPIVPCGGSDSLANGSGEVSYAVPGSGVSVKIPRYRGIENIFGHIWELHDGASVYHQTAGEGGLHKFYTCDDPANFADGTAVNYDYRSNLPGGGWVKDVTHDAKGIIIPKTVGADSVTNYCDFYYTPASGVGYWVALLRGGSADNSGSAGFVYLHSNFSAADAACTIGARLCFIP